MVKKNEQGYALLTVLLLITLITIVSAVFLSSSISNAKQEKTIDNNQLKVVVAEAGLDYTKVQFLNEFYRKKPELERQAEKMITDFKNSNTTSKTPENFSKMYKNVREKTAVALIAYLKEVNVSTIGSSTFDHNGNFYYDLDRNLKKTDDYVSLVWTNNDNVAIGLRKDGYTVEVSGAILGKMKGDQKNVRLVYEQTFTIPSFDPSNSPVPPNNGNGSLPININNLYPLPEPAKICASQRIDNEICVHYGVDNIKEMKISTVYFPNGFDNEKKGNTAANNSTFFVKKFLMLKNFNNNEKLQMYIDGTLKVLNNFKVNDSLIVVNGDAQIDNNLEIKQGSKVCIAGNLNAGKIKFGDSGHLYLLDIPSNNKFNGSNITKLSSKSEVLKQCLNNSVDTSFTVNWLEPVIDVIYK
ncbi:hypothetical protein [Sporosarcina gallistercoris]|uniref:Type 4 fimbrial biogenesis protein PilX N-terminal domain-containing protein n=1 Tax=Sporosarcina gallistercoris TaxID=2762245 RepID=A0ABR8PJM5_9BACL|nr:hypothetical protein [Sporosarcina gallistercoris]MBD7908396.1 hypothetical protein [Sporosarcina gallistercoris]